MKREELTAGYVRSVLLYRPETGDFVWIAPTGRRVKGGAIAGTSCPDGYRKISICGLRIMSHRIAWLYMTGGWPSHEIDHIDGDPSNNRWSNLRAATRSQNSANTKARKDSRSGIKGVSWHSRRRHWCAQINAGGKNIYLGAFNKAVEAAAAYEEAAIAHFGEFARAAAALEDAKKALRGR